MFLSWAKKKTWVPSWFCFKECLDLGDPILEPKEKFLSWQAYSQLDLFMSSLLP